MDKNHMRKTFSNIQRDEKRLTTAPIRERPKQPQFSKTNNIELPSIKGKNVFGRQHVVATRQAKRNHQEKHQQVIRWDNQYEEVHKRPQTSKGSRNMPKKQSQYYEQDEDDLIITSMQGKLDMFKKGPKEHTYVVKHP